MDDGILMSPRTADFPIKKDVRESTLLNFNKNLMENIKFPN